MVLAYLLWQADDRHSVSRTLTIEPAGIGPLGSPVVLCRAAEHAARLMVSDIRVR